eukprot:TRINITY_DN14755_c0_g1_i1.p1 TRINITY_DN14755_c0_g1~~TRINITY_DN14755_c0_g1_i1.p1  ORF type:complete len:175 (-),score=7.14 TRINITY_DN14755_c0_g1_i1:14-511(-)
MAHHRFFLLALFASCCLAINCTTLNGNKAQCIEKGCSWCSNYYLNSSTIGICYDPSTNMSCCAEFGYDCFYNTILCASTESCCMPEWDCEYAGQPRCCSANTSCCSARHSTNCCTPTQVCCSPNSMYSACCEKNEVCCGTIQNDWTWCCPEGTTCSASTDECTKP